MPLTNRNESYEKHAGTFKSLYSRFKTLNKFFNSVGPQAVDITILCKGQKIQKTEGLNITTDNRIHLKIDKELRDSIKKIMNVSSDTLREFESGLTRETVKDIYTEQNCELYDNNLSSIIKANRKDALNKDPSQALTNASNALDMVESTVCYLAGNKGIDVYSVGENLQPKYIDKLTKSLGLDESGKEIFKNLPIGIVSNLIDNKSAKLDDLRGFIQGFCGTKDGAMKHKTFDTGKIIGDMVNEPKSPRSVTYPTSQ